MHPETQALFAAIRRDPTLVRPLARDLISEIREARTHGRPKTERYATHALRRVLKERYSV